MVKALLGCALIGALGAAVRQPLLAAATEGGYYRWNQYQLELPKAGWRVAGDALDDQGNKRLSLKAGDDFLLVLITLFAKSPAPDRQALEKPAGAAVAFGNGLALKAAGAAGESAIALSYGSIELSSGPAPLARFTIGTGKEFQTLDSVVYGSEKGGAMYGALILGKGVRGQVDLSADHMRWTAEAYGIVRSIHIVQK